MLYIGVIGDGECDDNTYQTACEVGRLIAQEKAILVCGGLGGVMEAACKGAKSRDGSTLGILPSDNRRWANPYVDIAVPTGLGEARNALVAGCSDVLIAVGGQFGTLSEIALAIKTGKPVVGIGTWELSKHGKKDRTIIAASTPSEALAAALHAVRR